MMKEVKIKAFEFEKFDGIANKTSFPEIKKNLFECERIDLFPKEKVVKLNIPWGELYCICDKEEWNELYEILKNNCILIKRWTFLDCLFQIRRPALFFIIYLLLIISIIILYIRFIRKL